MKILIAGLAKTGTTGLLYLIANSLDKDKKPKLLFEPKTCPPNVQEADADVIAKVLIGGELDAGSFAHFDKKITIVRDPRDRIVSALLYSQFHANYLRDEEKVRLVHDCLKHKEADPASVSIDEILAVIGKAADTPKIVEGHKYRTKKSLAVFDSYVSAIPDGLLYKYEDFVSQEYTPIERHLGMAMVGEAVVPDRLNRVVRTKGYGDWRNWFTAEDVESYKPLLDPWLEKYGYDASDWALNKNPVIEPSHCSGYFMRLVEEGRNKPAAMKDGKRPAGKGPAARNAADGAGKPKQEAKVLTLTGKLVKAEPDLVAGWAIGGNPDEPVNLELLVNGKSMGTMLANKPRPGLKDRGVHPTGLCGFVFRFNGEKQLKVGDEVTVKSLGGEFTIENSPRPVAMAAKTAN